MSTECARTNASHSSALANTCCRHCVRTKNGSTPPARRTIIPSMRKASTRRPSGAGAGDADPYGRRSFDRRRVRRRPFGRILRETLLNDAVERPRDVAAHGAHSSRPFVQHALDQPDHVRVVERRASSQQVIQRRANRVDIGAHVERRTPELLGRGERRRAQEAAGAGERGLGLNGGRRRDAEVSDLNPSLGVDETVRRLDVAMQHTGGGGGLQACDHLQHHVDGSSGPHRAICGDQILERAAARQFHGDHRNTVNLLCSEHVHDVRVIHAGGEAALSKESRMVSGTVQPPTQRLQRDVAAGIEVLSFPDLAHPSTAEEASDLVVPEPLPDAETHLVLDPAVRLRRRCERLGGRERGGPQLRATRSR